MRALRRAADLVTGALYASLSEGVGLGDVTRGVAGTVDLRRAIVNENGGRTGQGKTPTRSRCKQVKPEGQERGVRKECVEVVAEWRLWVSWRVDRTFAECVKNERVVLLSAMAGLRLVAVQSESESESSESGGRTESKGSTKSRLIFEVDAAEG